MRKIFLLSLLLCISAISYTVRADDDLYVFGAPLDKTTLEDFSKILVDKGYLFYKAMNNSIIFNGLFSDRPAQIMLVGSDGYVHALTITMENINPLTASSLYYDLLYSFMETYANYKYEQQYEGTKSTSYFLGNGANVVLELNNKVNSYSISIFFLSDKAKDELIHSDEYEQDDSFEPDFETVDDDLSLSPKEIKDGDWSVSDEFITKPGNKGSYWFPTMKIICCTDGKYMLTIIRPATNGYFKVTGGDDCYLRLENDSIVTLKLNPEYSPWRYEREGYYTKGVYMKKKYITQTFYDIDDIRQLLGNNIVKVRWIEDEKPYDIDYKENKWMKKFNKSFQDAIVQATKKAREKVGLKEDKLLGF